MNWLTENWPQTILIIWLSISLFIIAHHFLFKWLNGREESFDVVMELVSDQLKQTGRTYIIMATKNKVSDEDYQIAASIGGTTIDLAALLCQGGSLCMDKIGELDPQAVDAVHRATVDNILNMINSPEETKH